MNIKKQIFDQILQWKNKFVSYQSKHQQEECDRQLKNDILKERLKLPWSRRESGFWLRLRGIKAYDDIKKVYLKKYSFDKAIGFLENLDCVIDEWDDFISKKRSTFENSSEFQMWEKYILKRDGYQCKACSSQENLKVHNIITLSEQIANKIKTNGCSIRDVTIKEANTFYDSNNGITLCFKCYDNNDYWGESQVEIHRMHIIEGYIMNIVNKQTEMHELSRIENEVKDKLKDPNFDSIKWFCEKLKEIRRLQNELIYSNHESAWNRLFEAMILFRIGEYDLAKRIAIRQDKYWCREAEERNIRNLKKRKKNFAARNREPILLRTIDKLIDLYKKGDYSIVYTTPEAYEAENFRQLFREAENEIRKEMGVPLIGEKWATETEVFYLVKDILSEYEVVRHLRPEWLEGQELDIYVPELKLAIEYMGEQHYHPIDFFGGEEGLKKRKEMDERKMRKVKQRGEKILYIRYDDDINKEYLKGKIISIIRNDG